MKNANRRCLVLNADYRPLHTHPLSLLNPHEAIKAVYRDRVDVLETWDEAFRSPNRTIQLPKVIALREYANIHALPKFNRQGVMLRDRFCCQYCGQQFPSHELTYDHVIPRAAGGKTTWDNILTCCVRCNLRKRNSLPNYSGRKGDGLRPLKAPRQPTMFELLKIGLEFLPPADQEDFGSWLYWNTELES